MKLIFLDVDGVLNYRGSTSRSPSGCLGIDSDKVKLLRQIIDQTGAIVILTSTWKTDWFPSAFIEDLPRDGQYLERSLAKHRVFIRAKTDDTSWEERGAGILSYIKNCGEKVDSFVILDDESFDFNTVGISNRHVKTSFENGLLETDIEKAVKILNTEFITE